MEKSRIVHQVNSYFVYHHISFVCYQLEDERNYHIFYRMLRGLPRDQLKALGLTKPDDYYYLTQVLCVLAIVALYMTVLVIMYIVG